jgi:protein-L-isoaspartate(D-aspartate) O-methyltransferase
MKFPPFFFNEADNELALQPDAELTEKLDRARRHMIEVDLAGRGIRDKRILRAMDRIPRHMFVDRDLARNAYDDSPLDIGYGQTISQPYIVAKMTELLEIGIGDRVLEIGSGSGYQAAVLMELGCFVYCVELLPELAAQLQQRLRMLGYANFKVSCHDGHGGWAEYAPYDAILVSAAPSDLPRGYFDQVHLGGRIVAPVGEVSQQYLMRWVISLHRWEKEEIFPVRFVPMQEQKVVQKQF